MAIARAPVSWTCLALILVVLAAPAVTAAAPGDPHPDFGTGGLARFTFGLAPGAQRIGRIVATPTGIVAVGSVDERLVRARLTEAGALDAAYPNGPLTRPDGSVLQAIPFGPADAALRPGGGVAVTAYGRDLDFEFADQGVLYLLDAAGRIEFANQSTIGLFFSSGGGIRPLTGAVAMQSGGRAVVIGTIPGSSGNRMIVVRHHEDADLDGSFGGNNTAIADLDPVGSSGVANKFGRAVTLQPDGRIVAVGVLGGTTSVVVGRFTSEGIVDASFAGDGVQNLTLPTVSVGGYVNVHVLPSGRVLVVASDRITALTAAGLPDTGFAANGTLVPAGPIVHTVMSPTGDFYVLTASSVTAYTSTGQVNTAFGSGGVKSLQVSGATSMALHPGGDLLVGSVDAAGLAVERIEGPQIHALSIADASITEGASGDRIVSVVVSLTPPSSETVNVSWATSPITATAGTDYRTGSGVLTFFPGQTTATIDVGVIGDALGEPDETFRLTLTSATGAVIGDGIAVVTIGNDDDRIPPVIAAKRDVVVESKSAPVLVSYTPPTATDSKDGAVAVTCSPRSGSSFPFGTTAVKCAARDKNGNTASAAFNVIVRLPTTGGAVTNPGNLDRELTRVAPGRRIRVTAGGFAPGSDVRLMFLTADGATSDLGDTTAGADGRIDVRPKIPRTAPAGPAEVLAIGDTGDGELVRVWEVDIR